MKTRMHIAVVVAPLLAIGSIAWQAARGETDAHSALRYVARCALAATATIEVNGETLHGGLGLAPAWGTRALDRVEERAVSGCLMALTNAAGQHIEVSLRTPLGGVVSSDERLGFPVLEGAFFGNVFAQPAAMYVCGGAAAMRVAEGRVCAQPGAGGTTACGFSYVGECSVACDSPDDSGAYRTCRANGVVFREPMTVFTRPRSAALAHETPRSPAPPAPATPGARDASLAASPAPGQESPHDVAPSIPRRGTAPAAPPSR